MTFCEKLVELRKEKGISQEALAEVLGVSRQAVSKWETGAAQPEMANILRLCDILEVSPNELLCHKSAEKLAEECEADNREAGAGQSAADENEEQQVSGDIDSEENTKSRVMKLVIALLLVICFVSGIYLGSAIKSKRTEGSSQQNAANIPIDFEVTGFDLTSEYSASTVNKFLKLTFTPNVSNPEYAYKIILTDENGHGRQIDAEKTSAGVYSCTFSVAVGSSYLLSVSMSVGDNTYSDTLLKIDDVRESGWGWTKIED